MADGTIKIPIDIDDKNARETIKNLEDDVRDLENVITQTDSKKMTNLAESMTETADTVDNLKSKLEQLNSDETRIKVNIDEIKELGDFTTVDDKGQEISALQDYNNKLQQTRDKQVEIKNELNEQINLQDTQVRNANLFFDKTAKIKDKINEANTEKISKDLAKGSVESSKLSNNMKRASKSSGDLSKNVTKGVRSLTKTALALFSIRTIYGAISKLGRQAVNSTEQWAVSARSVFSAFSSGLSNALAPVIKSISNMLLTLMGYINAITQAFFGITLFSGKTSNNIGSSVGGAKKLNKELKKINASFDTAEVVSSQLDDNLGGTGGGGASIPPIEIPTPDLSKFKNIIKNMVKALDPFIKTIKSINFDPLIASSKQFGNSLINILGVIGNSFIRILNDSVAPFIKIMSEEIAPRFLILLSEILDMLAPQLEWFLVNMIEPLIKFLMTVFIPVSFHLLLDIIELLIPVMNALIEGFKLAWGAVEPFAKLVGGALLIALELVSNAVKFLTEELKKEDSALADLLKVIGFVIGIYLTFKTTAFVVGGVITGFTNIITVLTGAFNAVLAIIKIVATFFSGAFTGAILPIIALIALIGTTIVGVITNFEQFKQSVTSIVNNIMGVLSGFINFIVGVFTGNWGRAWQGVVSIFTNIVSGIANIFKLPINTIIDGINFFLRQLNKIKIPKWVPGVGGFGINLGQIPRLAKGGVLRQPTLNLAGEYAGARTNPEIVTPQKLLDERIALGLENLGNVGSNQPITIINKTYLDGKQVAESVNEYNENKDFNMNGGLLWNT